MKIISQIFLLFGLGSCSEVALKFIQFNKLIFQKKKKLYLSRWKLMDLDPLGEGTRSIFLLHTRNHHAAPTSLPVNRRGHLASGGELEAVNHSEDFVEVSSCWRKFSVKLIRFCQKPVVAGYRRDSFSLLSGPMMNTALRGVDVKTLEVKFGRKLST